MELESELRTDKEVSPIYKNWQEEEGLLGYATIIQEIDEPNYTFILNDSTKGIPESLTPVYSFKTYRVKFIFKTPLGEQWVHDENSKFKIRYLKCLGLASSAIPEVSERDYLQSFLMDNFIKVDGIECF